MGETPTQYKDYLRCLLWYVDMPDMKLNFAKGYTRWTKFSFGGPVILKGGINPIQSMLQHSGMQIGRCDRFMFFTGT